MDRVSRVSRRFASRFIVVVVVVVIVVTSHDSRYGMRRAQPHRAHGARRRTGDRLIDSDSLVTMITFIHSSFRSGPSARHSLTDSRR